MQLCLFHLLNEAMSLTGLSYRSCQNRCSLTCLHAVHVLLVQVLKATWSIHSVSDTDQVIGFCHGTKCLDKVAHLTSLTFCDLLNIYK